MAAQSKQKKAKPSVGAKREKPPVKDYWELLDYRTYLRNAKRWVALCVVKGKNGIELRLYDWMWRGEEKGWKVAWANTNVASINLSQVTGDAKELAAKHGIQLKWV